MRFVENLSVLNNWVERMAVRGGWRLLPYLTFCIYLVREILFLSGKSQGKVREFWKLMSVATMEGDYGYFCYCEGDVLFQRWVWEFFLNNHMYMYVIFSWCSYTFLLIFTIGMSLQQYILILIWCGIPRRNCQWFWTNSSHLPQVQEWGSFN